MLQKYKYFLILGLFIFIAILVRSVHYQEYLNFSHDQGAFSVKAYELYKTKSIELIGPSTSFIWKGHEFYQGSVIYYMLLFFLILTNFDPLYASYIFMIFTTIMVVPLFFGIKNLVNEKAAYLMSTVYILLPFYIDYTKFLWNPNFQFSLFPILILLMGLYQKYKSKIVFLLIGVYLGFLLLFHYQFVLIILGIMVYYFLIKREKINLFPLLLVGLTIGFFPIILFELRNNFYNLRTLILILQHFNEIGEPNSGFPSHYFLSVSFFVLLIIISIFKRLISHRIIISVFIILLVSSITMYTLIPSPNSKPTDLKYATLQKIADAIKKDNPKKFNIVDQLTRDNQAAALRYLLTIQGVTPNSNNDYNSEHTLYIYSREPLEKLLKNPIYEIKSFLPFKSATTRKIEERIFLYTLSK